MNILFIGRDPASRRLMKDMLVEAGATLIEADGVSGGCQPAGGAVSLAIVEVGANGDGVAAIDRVRAWGTGRPAILALARDAALVEPCRAAGADEVLVEPTPLTDLFDAIVRHMPVVEP